MSSLPEHPLYLLSMRKLPEFYETLFEKWKWFLIKAWQGSLFSVPLESEVKTLGERYCLLGDSHSFSLRTKRKWKYVCVRCSGSVLVSRVASRGKLIYTALKLLSWDVFFLLYNHSVCQCNGTGCVRIPPWALIPGYVCMCILLVGNVGQDYF